MQKIPIILPILTAALALVIILAKPHPLVPAADAQSVQTSEASSSAPVTASVPAGAPAATGAATPVPAQKSAAPQNPTYPARLIIPSISLSDAVVPVGLTAAGDMAVPAGSTSNVGWYKGGVVPGSAGSAVFDAHVFAAFAKLKDVQVGDSLYVEDESGNQLRFVVVRTQTYALADLTPQMLFAPTNERDLNLITCAGNLTPDRSTYDHRLVIYATLAQ